MTYTELLAAIEQVCADGGWLIEVDSVSFPPSFSINLTATDVEYISREEEKRVRNAQLTWDIVWKPHTWEEICNLSAQLEEWE